MAFAGMFIIFLVMIILILGVLTIIGSSLLIIGLTKKKKAVSNGRKYHKVLIVLGSMCLAIPVLTVGGIVLAIVISGIKTGIGRLKYENCVDKWKNEWVSTNTVEKDVIDEFLSAADNGDRKALMALYSEKVQMDSGLERQIEAFLAEYPGELHGLKFYSGGTASSGSSNYGKSVETMTVNGEIIKEGEYYYISFGVCFENDYNPEEIGIEYFRIKSEKAEVLEDDDSFRGYADKDYAVARINVQEAFETRRIGGYPWRFEPIDRKLTQEQIIEAVKVSHSLKELENILGTPNGVNDRLDEVVYEIESVNGEPRYAVISHDYYGKIYVNNTHFTGTEQKNAQWLDENGNLSD